MVELRKGGWEKEAQDNEDLTPDESQVVHIIGTQAASETEKLQHNTQSMGRTERQRDSQRA